MARRHETGDGDFRGVWIQGHPRACMRGLSVGSEALGCRHDGDSGHVELPPDAVELVLEKVRHLRARERRGEADEGQNSVAREA